MLVNLVDAVEVATAWTTIADLGAAGTPLLAIDVRDGSPVLVDFGLAGRHLRPGCGTANYGAPEIWGTGDRSRAIPADVYAFAKSKGAYGGVSAEGGVVQVFAERNSAYYGKAVSPADIVLEHSVSNDGARALVAALSGK